MDEAVIIVVDVAVDHNVGMVAGMRLDGAEVGPVVVVVVADEPGQVGGRGSDDDSRCGGRR